MAVTLTRAQLQAAVNGHRATQPSEAAGNTPAAHVLDDDTATRLLMVATDSIEREAPRAPEAVQNEAAVRFVAWLSDDIRPIGADNVNMSYSAPELGDVRNASLDRTVSYHRGQSAMRLSGARALLSPWRVRSAVSSGGPDGVA